MVGALLVRTGAAANVLLIPSTASLVLLTWYRVIRFVLFPLSHSGEGGDSQHCTAQRHSPYIGMMRVLCLALVALALAEEVELEQARLQKISLGPNSASRHAGEAKLAIDAELDLAEELTAVAAGESSVLTIDADPDSPARAEWSDCSDR